VLLALSLSACGSAHRPPGKHPETPASAERQRLLVQEHKCRNGELPSCTFAGIAYHGGTVDGVPMNWATALELLLPACDANVPEACVVAVQILETGGQGVQRDAARANAIADRMCAQGSELFCTRARVP
jgi:TPR repeat protein